VIDASPEVVQALSLSGACAVLDVNRGSGYRLAAAETGGTRRGRPPVEDAALVAATEAAILAHPGYGRPRVTEHLRRAGWPVNPKRVYRVLREGGWLRVRKRHRVRTTQSDHDYPRFPNLLSDCGWRRLTAPDQAWAADLTYIRLEAEFCYLAVVLDLFSRKLIGWNLSRSLEAQGALQALEMALTQRTPAAGWIHHSDRGVQYACHDYVQRLQTAQARISMCATGEPKENALAERVIRTIKEEEVDLQEYRSFGEAQREIGRFIEEVYNRKRLHSALGYRPPSEFEEIFAAALSH
jgi:transposase InsO family protein